MHFDKKRQALIYLNYIRVNNRRILELAEKVDLDKFFELEKEELSFLDKRIFEKIFDPKNLEEFKYYQDKLDTEDFSIVTIFDEDYPENLKNIPDRPALLYYKGKLEENDKYSVAFVGARRCTDYGKRACQKLVSEVAEKGITTVSGLAYGIDSICHTTSLRQDKRTIGVIGCGIDVIYPKQNRRLYQEMEEKGLILSEFPLETPPASYNFPQRNRIISGLSLATVVVEAKEKSGTMITTNFALEQGREVFCVPGNINSIYSKGTNKLIQEGSKLVTCAEDIIEEIREFSFLEEEKIEEKDYSYLENDEIRLIKYIEENPNANPDLMSQGLQLSIDDVNYLLTSLELKDFIENIGNNLFAIKRG